MGLKLWDWIGLDLPSRPGNSPGSPTEVKALDSPSSACVHITAKSLPRRSEIHRRVGYRPDEDRITRTAFAVVRSKPLLSTPVIRANAEMQMATKMAGGKLFCRLGFECQAKPDGSGGNEISPTPKPTLKPVHLFASGCRVLSEAKTSGIARGGNSSAHSIPGVQGFCSPRLRLILVLKPSPIPNPKS